MDLAFAQRQSVSVNRYFNQKRCKCKEVQNFSQAICNVLLSNNSIVNLLFFVFLLLERKKGSPADQTMVKTAGCRLRWMGWYRCWNGLSFLVFSCPDSINTCLTGLPLQFQQTNKATNQVNHNIAVRCWVESNDTNESDALRVHIQILEH